MASAVTAPGASCYAKCPQNQIHTMKDLGPKIHQPCFPDSNVFGPSGPEPEGGNLERSRVWHNVAAACLRRLAPNCQMRNVGGLQQVRAMHLTLTTRCCSKWVCRWTPLIVFGSPGRCVTGVRAARSCTTVTSRRLRVTRGQSRALRWGLDGVM